MCAPRALWRCAQRFWLFDQRAARGDFEILVKVAAKTIQLSALRAPDHLDRELHRALSGRGSRVRHGVCIESLERGASHTHTLEKNEREREGGCGTRYWVGYVHVGRKKKKINGGGPCVKLAFLPPALSHQGTAVQHKTAGYKVRGVCTLFPPVDAHF